mmetsp:Transcript_38846/g.111577  ORF Transcript_38846/g.111577 Transcript_38846/m.111577 type:complete len:211 (-) Transcript_38846:880-1512(-)
MAQAAASECIARQSLRRQTDMAESWKTAREHGWYWLLSQPSASVGSQRIVSMTAWTSLAWLGSVRNRSLKTCHTMECWTAGRGRAIFGHRQTKQSVLASERQLRPWRTSPMPRACSRACTTVGDLRLEVWSVTRWCLVPPSRYCHCCSCATSREKSNRMLCETQPSSRRRTIRAQTCTTTRVMDSWPCTQCCALASRTRSKMCSSFGACL